MEKKNRKVGWVFWIKIEYRKNWFSFFWKTRGANYIEFQIWVFKISIGLPWKKRVVNGYTRVNKHLKIIKDTNENNAKMRFAIHFK